MAKHAYLISAHTAFDQLEILLKMLDDPRNDIFLHIDKRAKNVPLDKLKASCNKSGLYFTPRMSVHWGGPSQIWSELLLLKEAASKEHYAYYHLLSGMDLPIKSQDYIHEFFEKNNGKEFVSFWQIKAHTPSRFIWVPLSEYGRNFAANLLNCIFKGIGRAMGTDKSKTIDYRYGPNWFSITDDLIRYVLGKEEWIHRTFSHKCNCDEIFLQTIVASSPFMEKCFNSCETPSGDITMANLRLIDWSRGESSRHPWTFRKDDLQMLLDAPHLWARKFDENKDKEIIRLIAEKFTPLP